MAQQSGHKRDNMVVLSDDEEASTDSNSAQPSKKRRKLNDGQAHGLTKSTKKQSNNLTQRSIFSSFGLKDPNPPKQQKQSKKHDKKAMRFKANTNTNDTQTVQSVCDSDHPLIPFNPKERKNDVLSHTIDGIAVYKCQKRHTKRQWTNAKYIKTGNEIQYIQSNCFYFTEDKYNSIKKNAGLKGNIYEFMKFEDKMDTTDSDQHAVSSISWHCYACHEYNQSHQSVITTSTLKSIVEGVPLNCSTISRVDVWKRHLKQQDGKALTYHSCAVKWLAVRRKDMLSHMMNEEVLKQAKRNSSFAQWFPIFTAVYYGVMHNESILGILDCRNDLLPVITEYYLKCLKANIIDKSKEVNDKLKSKLEIDLKHIVDPKSHDKLNEILSVIDKRGKAYVEWIKSHQLHELAFLRKDFYGAYNNREGIKQIIACIADTLRDESFELWKASPYLSLLGDESTDKGDCQRMLRKGVFQAKLDSW